MITEKISIYDIIGYFVPGVILTYGFVLFYPSVKLITIDSQLSVGSLGLYTIVSYTAGQIIQSVGNFLTTLYWLKRGRPTDWIFEKNNNLLSDHQKNRLIYKLVAKKLVSKNTDFKKMKQNEWSNIVRQIISIISNNDNSPKRLEIFNSNYGLWKGLTTSLLFLCIMSFIRYGISNLLVSISLIIITILSVIRMRRFGIYYAKELFYIFIN